MNMMSPALWAVAAAAVLLSACSSQPPTQFHSLLAPPTSASASASPASAASASSTDAPAAGVVTPLLYDMGLISIPPQVNQPQFVIRNPDNSLTMLEEQRWIAPLADEMRGALSERLDRRFNTRVARHSVPGERAVERLSIDVLRFEALPAQEVRIEASWSVRTLGDSATGVSCRSEIRQSIGPGFEAMTAGFRTALSLLADDIGPVMRSLRNGPTVCR